MNEKRRVGEARNIALSEDECRAMLGSVNVGRIAWVHDNEAHVLPVNFLLSNGNVVFRTSVDSMLARQGIGAGAAFEVDSVDFGRLTGWSVVVTGTCAVVDDSRARALAIDALTPWADGAKEQVLTINATSLTGRRLVSSV